MFHLFSKSIEGISIPYKFTYPFNYSPHRLAIMAADQLKEHIKLNLNYGAKGKMFGVLVVKNNSEQLGFLAAFSGAINIEDSYFVPPIYDVFNPNDYFRKEERRISRINEKIRILKTTPAYVHLKKEINLFYKTSFEELENSKERMRELKQLRDEKRRMGGVNEAVLTKESQYVKAEHRRLEKKWKSKIQELEVRMKEFEDLVDELKLERKQRSTKLQQWIFDKYLIINSEKKYINISELFTETPQSKPPAGAGDCAAPKLLQFAFENDLTPIAMAEFWSGKSPLAELRVDGNYYPACHGKCKPILSYMLKGVTMDEDPLLKTEKLSLEYLYEDEEVVVVNKPTKLLSVPGNQGHLSVYDIIKAKYPNAEGPLLVHRLDMDTSGVLIVAKSRESHKFLQNEFYKRRVKKQYIAILEKQNIERKVPTNGRIILSLSPDLMDRPRQIVDSMQGKEAITDYEVVKDNKDMLLVRFYPLTGRTHQLRVHAAHYLGLNSPIKGDNLYGKKSNRLYLHAEKIEFRHPITKEKISVTANNDFFDLSNLG